MSKSVKSLLPEPFDWCEIPAGKTRLKTSFLPYAGKTFLVPAFHMAKYPITNKQYKVFVDAGGYQKQEWWSEVGWEACHEGYEKNKLYYGWHPTGIAWKEPFFWKDPILNEDEQPVVGVSWYEAVAFCLWLSVVTGEKITLPTVQQWQRAAQGDDKRKFPWGGVWSPHRCHNFYNHPANGANSPVRQFEGKGDSPYGVVDMAGNVQEWCLTNATSDNNDLNNKLLATLRGGWVEREWLDAHRIDHSDYGSTHMRDNSHVSFRIARLYE